MMRLGRFALVGSLGFAVDAGLLHLLLMTSDLGPYRARIPAFLAAATTTWALNRRWTFTDRGSGPRLQQWTRYQLAMLGGALVNYAVYAGMASSIGVAAHYPVIAVAGGSLAGLTVNFLSARHLVFVAASRAPSAHRKQEGS